MEHYPVLLPFNDDNDVLETVRQGNALISLHFKIPFPEDLDDDVWIEKWRQIQWLSENKMLGVKII